MRIVVAVTASEAEPQNDLISTARDDAITSLGGATLLSEEISTTLLLNVIDFFSVKMSKVSTEIKGKDGFSLF